MWTDAYRYISCMIKRHTSRKKLPDGEKLNEAHRCATLERKYINYPRSKKTDKEKVVHISQRAAKKSCHSKSTVCFIDVIRSQVCQSVSKTHIMNDAF